MFKYIDNKTERSVEATIKTLATKDDMVNTREEIANVKYELRKDMGEIKYELGLKINNSFKWAFVFWIGQFGAIIAILLLILKK